MSNMLRISGLATGMDTDTTVKQLMKPYNMKLDKMRQDKQVMQWKQEMMRDMIKELRELKSSYLNIDSPDATNMVKMSSFSVANITSSNENILTATALPGAVNVPSQVSVSQVAKPAKITGKLQLIDSVKDKENLSLSTTMSNLGFSEGEEIVLKYGKDDKEEIFSVKIGKDDTLQSFINNLNSSKSSKTGAAFYEKGKISFSELTGSLNIETRNTGTNETINISTNPSTILATKLGITSNEFTGQDAIVKIVPGGGKIEDAVTVTKSSNDFTIDNVKYSLNGNAVINTGTSVDVELTSKTDAQKSVDKIKGFIDKYNTIVDKIYSKYTEKKQYKFLPLTDEQKKDMKEDEIKKWEVKAKEGIIKGDEALGSMLNSMRNAIFTPVEGSGISLKDIGLDSYSGIESTTKPGQIKIDTAKLKTALETRGDQVMRLFSTTADKSIIEDSKLDSATKTKKIYDNTGIFKRLNDILNSYVGKSDAVLLKKVGIEGTFSYTKNDLTDNMRQKDVVISQMEKKMATQEERYYKKFAALEKAMNALNSQSNWLTSQLGGGK